MSQNDDHIGEEAEDSSRTLDAGKPLHELGSHIGSYKLLRILGEGGFGIVYLAEQQRPMKRQVALKIIKPGMDSAQVIRRFEAERQALALLDHPHVAHVYDAGTTEAGRLYFAMEYVKGVPITEHCDRQKLTIEERLKLFVQVCEAIQHAHQKGIIHRDIKPSNIQVCIEGEQAIPKVIDFGVAKALSQPLTERTLVTEQGQLIGTPEYISPEQAEMTNQDIDTRSDIYSLGVLLYEMLTGTLPFESQTLRQGSLDQMRQIIRETEPKTPSTRVSSLNAEMCTRVANRCQSDAATLRRRLHGDLDWITLKAMEKDRMRRYQTAHALAEDIKRHLNNEPVLAGRPGTLYRFQKLVRRNKVVLQAAAVVVGALCVIGVLATWHFRREARIRWARQELLPKIEQLWAGEAPNAWAAYELAKQADKYIHGDPVLNRLFERISQNVKINSNPTGARIYAKPYSDPSSQWRYIGNTPADHLRLPMGFSRIKLEREGFQTVYDIAWVLSLVSDMLPYKLLKAGSLPAEMELLPDASNWYGWAGDPAGVRMPGLEHLEAEHVGDFLMDRFEVTNKAYKLFVDAGGYQNPKYWKHSFIKNGQTLTWEEAVTLFTDKTGRPGPATWEGGDYPDGRDDYPVAGVSWYEASAYAEFVGKSLPTIYHWDRAALTWASPEIVPRSNLNGKGPMPVGSSQSMNRFGVYDLAGNVREWCFNESTRGGRFILGGGWDDPAYTFNDAYAQAAFDRSETNGFRCIKCPGSGENRTRLEKTIRVPFRDFLSEKPVSDETFALILRQYAYDKTELNAREESSEEEGWTRKKIMFNAAYGSERMSTYLFLPKEGRRPYQTVVLFPGSDTLHARSSESLLFPVFLVKSGRAVVYPIYKSTYERGDDLKSDYPNETNFWKEHVIMWAKDLGRSIDYLETRDDIDAGKLAYFGFSWGGAMGGIMPAVERRIKASVLVVAGLQFQPSLPEAEPVNFLPRVKTPVLMLNGKYDFFFPYETSQVPFYKLLGTPEEDKKIVVYEGGHSVPETSLVKETLSWLDRYLGPVR